jgi:hypothetical protein
MALYTLRRYEQSAATFGQMLSWDLLRHSCLAACRARLGQGDEAQRATSRALEAIHMTYDGLNRDSVRSWLDYVTRFFRFRRPEDRTHLIAGFRLAGLPV